MGESEKTQAEKEQTIDLSSTLKTVQMVVSVTTAPGLQAHPSPTSFDANRKSILSFFRGTFSCYLAKNFRSKPSQSKAKMWLFARCTELLKGCFSPGAFCSKLVCNSKSLLPVHPLFSIAIFSS